MAKGLPGVLVSRRRSGSPVRKVSPRVSECNMKREDNGVNKIARLD